MNKIKVTTGWLLKDDAADPPQLNRPEVIDDYPLQAGIVVSWGNATMQPIENIPPSPNMYVIEMKCDDATLALIEADPKYIVLTVEAA